VICALVVGMFGRKYAVDSSGLGHECKKMKNEELGSEEKTKFVSSTYGRVESLMNQQVSELEFQR
jgi:hypothetical protein